MRVTVHYTTQLRSALNCNQEDVELPAGSTVGLLLEKLAVQHASPFAQYVVDGDRLMPNIIVTVGDQQVINMTQHKLNPGDVVTILSAISGG